MGGQRTKLPPRHQKACTGQVGTVVTRRFPATCASVAAARHFLRQQLGSDGCDPDIESVALMVSELATNAVQHAQTEFEVGIWVTPDGDGRSVLVRVTDNAPGSPAPQNPPVDAAHGRGLRIVEALAARWGVEQEEFGPGKTVWFRARVGPVPPWAMPWVRQTRTVPEVVRAS